jgi:hypothetical protein
VSVVRFWGGDLTHAMPITVIVKSLMGSPGREKPETNWQIFV